MAKGQRAYFTANDHPANCEDAETYCETFHYYVELPEAKERPRTYHSDRLGAVTIPEE